MKRKSDVKFILFDLDGTLLDSMMYIVGDFTHLFLLHHKHVPSIEEMIGFSGPTLQDSFRKYFPEIPYQTLYDEYQEYYNAYADSMLNLYPDEMEVLRKLVDNGYQLAILSTKHRSAVLHDCKAVGLDPYFVDFFGGDECDEAKPSPKGAQLLMERNHVRKEECFLIGDSASDILCGRNAGIRTGLVRWGLKKKPDVCADEEYESFRDIERSFLL